MRRPLTMMFLIGMIGMIMLAGMGAFFTGKVGGADSVGEIRLELSRIYAIRIEKPEELTVAVCHDGERAGLAVTFTPTPSLLRRSVEVERLVGRMARSVFGHPGARKSVSFVAFRLLLPDGEVRELRVERP